MLEVRQIMTLAVKIYKRRQRVSALNLHTLREGTVNVDKDGNVPDLNLLVTGTEDLDPR